MWTIVILQGSGPSANNDTVTPKEASKLINPESGGSKNSMVKRALDILKESKKGDDDPKITTVEGQCREEPIPSKSEHRTEASGERNNERDKDREREREMDMESERAKTRDLDRERDYDKEQEQDEIDEDREKVKDRKHRSMILVCLHGYIKMRNSETAFLGSLILVCLCNKFSEWLILLVLLFTFKCKGLRWEVNN